MVDQEILVIMLGSLLVRLPILLIWLVGVIIAIVRWQRHPRTSLMLVLGLAILTLASLIGVFWEAWLPQGAARIGVSRIGALASVYGIVQALISAVGWVLVIIAVFSKRPEVPANHSMS